MGNIFSLNQSQEVIEKNNKLYTEFINKVGVVEQLLDGIIKTSSKISIFTVLHAQKINKNDIYLSIERLNEHNKKIIYDNDIRNEELKNKVNNIMKSLKKKADKIKKQIIESSQICKKSSKELGQIQSNLYSNKPYSKDNLKKNINKLSQDIAMNCDEVTVKRSFAKYINIMNKLKKNNNKIGGRLNYEQKYKKYKKKYLHLKKSDLYSNNGQ